MLKDFKSIDQLEKDFIADNPLSYSQALRILESMWAEGVKLGVLPLQNPFEGLDIDFKIAKALNSCSKKFSHE